VLEKVIEKKVCDYAKTKQVLVYKFTSPGRAAVPDRLLITRDGRCFFIEFKRAGQKPTAPQEREHQTLRGHKMNVFVIDNVENGMMVIDLMAGIC
jgi:hypothetical protein